MMWQHCGRLNDHTEHDFVARQRVVVETCVCSERVCICPEIPAELQRSTTRREKFRCPGRIKTEGAPAHMPVRVGV